MRRHDIACLNHLATILVDAGKLYARAARIADDPKVVDRIERTMAERDRLLTEIRSLIISLRGEQRENGTFLGSAHKAFLNARALFDNDEKSALGEVQRGERYLCEEIRKSIRNDELSAEVRAFLGLALDRIVSGEMRIEGALEDVKHRPQPPKSIHPMPPHN
ncbi:MAG: PA2169 family four-helix-bundle protein [Terricaulis sp.]